VPGDRFVLRDTGRGETIGGGDVLDVDPVLRPARAAPDRRVERVVAEHGWILATDLTRRTGVTATPTLGGWVVDPDALDSHRDQLRRRLDEAGDAGVSLATLDGPDRLVITTMADVTTAGGRVWMPGQEPSWATSLVLDALRAEPFHPPDAATLRDASSDPGELNELVRRGLAVRRDGYVFASDAVERAAEVVAQLLAENPSGVTLAQVRDALGTSRSPAAALLGLLDDSGRTRRRRLDDGRDVRVAGPRLTT
jgi:selenocysteine-specific elongation factor